jgi:hypothetical protein
MGSSLAQVASNVLQKMLPLMGGGSEAGGVGVRWGGVVFSLGAEKGIFVVCIWWIVNNASLYNGTSPTREFQ